jgi:hypothetical protein
LEEGKQGQCNSVAEMFGDRDHVIWIPKLEELGSEAVITQLVYDQITHLEPCRQSDKFTQFSV